MFSLYDMRAIRALRAAAAANAKEETPETLAALIAAEQRCFGIAGVRLDGTIAYAEMEEYQTSVCAPTSPTWGSRPTGAWNTYREYGDSPSSPPRAVERPAMIHGPDTDARRMQWGPDSPCAYAPESERPSSPCGYRSPTDVCYTPTPPDTEELAQPVAAKRARDASPTSPRSPRRSARLAR